MHPFFDTWGPLATVGISCLLLGQTVWFVAGGTYNSLCCLARGQSALVWLREIPFVHLHALLPPIAYRRRVSPHILARRFPRSAMWYRIATAGMLGFLFGVLLTIIALALEILGRLAHP